MKLLNDALLASYRGPGQCEWCGKWNRLNCGHHVWARGSGRLDIPVNLLRVGMDYFMDCPCHRKIEDRVIPMWKVVRFVAQRERVTPDQLEAEILYLRNLAKPNGDAAYNRVLDEHTQRMAAMRRETSVGVAIAF